MDSLAPVILPDQDIAKMLREFLTKSCVAQAISHGTVTVEFVDGGVAQVEVSRRFRGAGLRKEELIYAQKNEG